MKPIKIPIIFFSLVFASSVFAQSFRSGSEPNGFRNLQWGTQLSTLSEMKYSKTSKAGGSFPVGTDSSLFYLDIYSKIGDELKVEGVKVERIEYGFWKGKFCEVTITLTSNTNWLSLKKTIFSRFGKGKVGKIPTFCSTFGLGELEWHVWLGKITEMDLFYNEIPEIRELWMGSTELREKALKEFEQEQRRWKQVNLH